ncbi:MAG: hypothetical protein M0Z85_09120 [Gammaproteobacteria bacterium]|nr:hypothetical protein [Gammaproteobacteria bacterium]
MWSVNADRQPLRTTHPACGNTFAFGLGTQGFEIAQAGIPRNQQLKSVLIDEAVPFGDFDKIQFGNGHGGCG